MRKFLTSLFLLISFSAVFAQNQLQAVCELPNLLEEISGMAFDHERNLIWAVNDAGNDAVIYGFDPQKCSVKTTIYVNSAYNKDWESLTIGSNGSLFVGDIGNNNYNRKTLKIYWIDLSQAIDNPNAKVLTTTIKIPKESSKKGNIRFDIEAMVHIDGYFYLFSKTKNKGNFSGTAEVFKAAAVPGAVHATKVGKIKICNSSHNCKITDAAFNDNTKTLVLLSHKNIWLIKDFITQLDSKEVHSTRFKLDKSTQKEAITFMSNHKVFISEEKTKGPNLLYTFSW